MLNITKKYVAISESIFFKRLKYILIFVAFIAEEKLFNIIISFNQIFINKKI